MTDHVGKPFDLALLVRTIRQHTAQVQPPMTGGDAGAGTVASDVPAHALALAAEQHIDLHTALQRVGGSSKAYTRFLQRFIDDYPRQMAELKAAVTAGEFKAGARVAHTLKGLAGTLGITPLVDLSVRAERGLAAARQAIHGDEPVRLLAGFELERLRALLAALTQPTESIAPETQVADAPALQGMQILLVDDSEINLDVTRHQLQRLGAVVTCASSGSQAITQLSAWPQRFDAVLMDVQMPDMDGLETTRRIRSELALTTLPVIALSAGTQPNDRQDALAAGMNDFLSKALDPQELQRVLREHIDRVRQGIPEASEPQHSPVVPSGAVPCMDLAVALDRMGGDEALMRRSLRRLLAEFGPLRHEPAPAHLDPAGRAALAARMHKLKGGASLLEARRLTTVARGLEDLLRAEAPWSSVVLLWPPLGAALAELEDATAGLCALEDGPPLTVSDAGAIDDGALATFRQMLLTQDLDALAFFDRHRAGLEQRVGSAAVQQMAELLDALDFDGAAALTEIPSPA